MYAGSYLLLSQKEAGEEGLVSVLQSPASEDATESCMKFDFSIFVSKVFILF